MTEWIYENSADNRARFILGETGTRPLICIGVNPSTAAPEKLDPTLRAVKAWSKRLGFDGWIMLNLYPLRATNPDDLPEKIEDFTLHTANMASIGTCLNRLTKPLTIWAAWGNLIMKRRYLPACLDLIRTMPETQGSRWIHIGHMNNSGHPHHPLYLRADSRVFDFEHIIDYTVRCLEIRR